MQATWHLPNGKTVTAEVKPGLNLMEAAVANNIPNVIGECGGSLSCATCHVVVDPAWASRTGLPAPSKTTCSTLPTPTVSPIPACPARSK